MTIHEYRHLLSERGALDRLIAETPSDKVISRMSLQRRRNKVEAELAAYAGRLPRQIDACLTFQGSPVSGNRGIHADFVADALKAFASTVNAVGASQHSTLGSRGVVPQSDNYRLLITDTVRGSFGFRIEDASQQPMLPLEPSPVERALERVKAILEASIRTDDDLSEAITESDQRALSAMRNFLKTVADQNAVCAMEFRGNVFRFSDSAQVRRSEQRLSVDNIRENQVVIDGRFEGFLPNSRRAEFLVDQTDAEFLRDEIGKIITCQVAPFESENDINRILGVSVRIYAHARRVGLGRPRYLITSCEHLG